MKTIELKPNEILVYRTCKKDMTSYGGFVWPAAGPVEAPDWEITDECGHGLHGLPWGVGDPGHCDGEMSLVVRVDTSPDNYVHGSGDIRDKCKFRRGVVVFAGSREDAIALIQEYAPRGARINWARQTAGNDSTQTAGYASTQTAGDDSTQTAGYASTQTAGYRSTQTAGNASTQTAGHDSTQTAGYASTQTAGYRSTQTAGDASTQTAGDASTQTAGDASTQTAGVNTVQIIRYYRDGLRVKCRVVTEKEAGKTYKFNSEIEDWVEVK